MQRLLLIEDNRVLRLVEARQLEEAFSGVEVVAVKDGAETKAYLSANAPDVVVMDCVLPDCTCVELLPDILRSCPEAKIVVTSAEIPPHLRSRAGDREFFGFLDKPYELEELVDMVKGALKAGRTGEQEDASGVTESDDAPGFDRHKTLNHLSGLLAGLRAFEADLRADADERRAVLADVDEYIPRLIGTVRELTTAVKTMGTPRGQID